jgi:hypothetical protein
MIELHQLSLSVKVMSCIVHTNFPDISHLLLTLFSYKKAEINYIECIFLWEICEAHCGTIVTQ